MSNINNLIRRADALEAIKNAELGQEYDAVEEVKPAPLCDGCTDDCDFCPNYWGVKATATVEGQ